MALPPSRPRSLRSPEDPARKKRRAARTHPKKRETLTAPPGRRRADARGARTGHRGHYPIRREKAPPPPGDRGQPPRTPRTGPGQRPERRPCRCMPLTCSKNMPFAGVGWLVGLRSMSTDLTPSKSKGSEVGKHYSPTHQPPKKTKPKSRSKSKSKSRSKPSPVQEQQEARVRPGCGTEAAKGAGQTSTGKDDCKERALNQTGGDASETRGLNHAPAEAPRASPPPPPGGRTTKPAGPVSRSKS
jgi:hypothetical protein